MKKKQLPAQSQPIHRKPKETEPVTHVLLTLNKSVSGWQTRQETNNQNSDLFKVATNALGLRNQDTPMTYVLLTWNKSLSR